MTMLKTVFMVLFAVFAGFSQEIKISGRVTGTGTTPLSGAAVKLEKNGLTATTEADGKFILTNVVSIQNTGIKLHKHIVSARINNGVLFLNIKERGLVEVNIYTLQGQAVLRVQKIMDIGQHSIAQPPIGDGVYVYLIKSEGSELVIKSPSMGSYVLGSAVNSQGITATARLTNSYAPYEDFIAVKMDGYLNYRMSVWLQNPGNTVIDSLEIKMLRCADTVRDIDGNLYQAVRIGISNQIWTVENLRVTKYNDGTAIPYVTGSSEWSGLTTPAYCYYKNIVIADTIKKYGAYYNWYVVSPTNPKKIAPSGWRVPTDAEWDTLQNYLIAWGYNWDGTTTGNKIAKALAAETDWAWSGAGGAPGNNLSTNNRTGFSALPGGYRNYEGTFYPLRNDWNCWSATENATSDAWGRYLFYNYSDLRRVNVNKKIGYSIRLVRDVEE